MKRFLALALTVTICSASFPIDLSQLNRYDSKLMDTECNKDTQIDFFFSSKSKATFSTETDRAVQNLSQSKLKFLDVQGYTLTLTLKHIDYTVDSLVKQYDNSGYFAFVFQTDNQDKEVNVIVGVAQGDKTPSGIDAGHIVKVNNFGNVNSTIDFEYQYDQTFVSLRELTAAKLKSGISLSMFNFLNLRNFGHFFSITNSAKTQTVLISDFLYKVPSTDIQTVASATVNNLAFNPKQKTGDKFCYGSLENQGIFQTHMRENWPLWTAWFAILLFWVYYLVAENYTNQVYDPRFQNNKMTCWGFYSVHYLAHDDFFTRLSRLSQMLLNFSFQAMVLAAIYSTLGDDREPRKDNEIIIWSALIALGVSLPIPFITGGTFLRSIYLRTLQKYEITKRSKHAGKDKQDSEEVLEQQFQKKEQTLYTLYYWFYMVVFFGFVCFWTASVHMMIQLHRDYYYLHGFWLGSLVITFALDHLLFDPILSVVLGKTSFYRLRGYYYNFKLGLAYKQIEE